MYLDWKDQTGTLTLKVKPSWFGISRESHTAFFKNDADKEVSNFSIDLNYMDRKGRIIDTRSILFNDVAPHSEHRSDLLIQKRMRIRQAKFYFGPGYCDAIEIAPDTIKIRHSPLEALRITFPKLFGVFCACLTALFAYPFLSRRGMLPDYTAASKIETCIQQQSNYRPKVSIEDSWITARYYYDREDVPSRTGFLDISLYADQNKRKIGDDQSGYISILETGYVQNSGKYHRLYTDNRWKESGIDAPVREDTRILKECAIRALPDRAYNLG